ncbi:MAG: hypothetical protein ABSG46_14235 [Candidatus Binataceae bacterium]|jgi:hypothetical protein
MLVMQEAVESGSEAREEYSGDRAGSGVSRNAVRRHLRGGEAPRNGVKHALPN